MQRECIYIKIIVLVTTFNSMANEKKSIIKEALIDMKDIQEAAEANANKRLAKEFPEKFNNLLKEELNKNKKSAGNNR